MVGSNSSVLNRGPNCLVVLFLGKLELHWLSDCWSRCCVLWLEVPYADLTVKFTGPRVLLFLDRISSTGLSLQVGPL